MLELDLEGTSMSPHLDPAYHVSGNTKMTLVAGDITPSNGPRDCWGVCISQLGLLQKIP
jgi:hypothetical protein